MRSRVGCNSVFLPVPPLAFTPMHVTSLLRYLLWSSHNYCHCGIYYDHIQTWVFMSPIANWALWHFSSPFKHVWCAQDSIYSLLASWSASPVLIRELLSFTCDFQDCLRMQLSHLTRNLCIFLNVQPRESNGIFIFMFIFVWSLYYLFILIVFWVVFSLFDVFSFKFFLLRGKTESRKLRINFSCNFRCSAQWAGRFIYSEDPAMWGDLWLHNWPS